MSNCQWKFGKHPKPPKIKTWISYIFGKISMQNYYIDNQKIFQNLTDVLNTCKSNMTGEYYIVGSYSQISNTCV